MKNKIIVITLALMLSLSACTSQDTSHTTTEPTNSATETTESTESTEIETQPQTEKETEPETETITEPPTETPKEDLKEFSIQTSEFTKSIDDEFIKIIESKGIEVTKTEENISFSGTQTIFSEIAKEYKNKLEEMSNGVEDNDDYVSCVEIDDGYKSVTFYVEDGFENSLGAFALLLYLQPMSELQMLEGTPLENVKYTQKIINVDTLEVISESTMPDALESE